MYHWTDSKIQVHAFYCVLALLLTSLLQRDLARRGEELSVNRILDELGGIQETLIVYPRRQGQRQHTTATCLTRMSPLQESTVFSTGPEALCPSVALGHTHRLLSNISGARACLGIARYLVNYR